MIRLEKDVDVARAPNEVFALLGDVGQTPRWLSRCVSIEQTSSGPLAVGSKLHYTYKEGSRTGTMDGEVVSLERDKLLALKYGDKMFDVALDFALSASGAGTRVRHSIQIAPRSLFGKLMQPLIRRVLPKQTERDLAKLKDILEGRA